MPIVSTLSIGDGSPIYLFEIQAYRNGAIETLYYSTVGYNHPSAPAPYQERVIKPPKFGRFLLSPGGTSTGSTKVTVGEVIIANDDGALDDLRDSGLAGQKCTILFGYRNLRYETFITLAVAKIEQALFDLSIGSSENGSGKDQVTLRLRDRTIDLSKPLQSTKFLGNNVLPAGLEGADDIKDKPKPLGWGEWFNAIPPCVNTSRLIYYAAGEPIAVYDKADALTRDTDYASQAAMEASAPSAGHYGAWHDTTNAVWYFRLGANPDGTLTFDGVQGTAAADRTAAQVAYNILIQGGLTSSEISASDIIELDLQNNAVTGIYIDNETAIQDAVDRVLSSVGASGGFDRLDVYRLRRLNLPIDTGALPTLRDPTSANPMKLYDLPIIGVAFSPTTDPDKGVPAYQVSLNYKLNYTVQQGDGIDGATLADAVRVAFVNNQYRSAVATADWIQTPSPLAVQKKIDTLLIELIDAENEADRLLTLYAGRRDFVEVTTRLTRKVITLIDIGDTVGLALPRYGYTDGLPMIVSGMLYNAENDTLELQLWGGSDAIIEALADGTGFDGGHVTVTPKTGWTSLGFVGTGGVDRTIDLGQL